MKKLTIVLFLIILFSCEKYIEPEEEKYNYECKVITNISVLQFPYEDRIFVDTNLINIQLFENVSLGFINEFEETNKGRFVLSTTEAMGDIFVITKTALCKINN